MRKIYVLVMAFLVVGFASAQDLRKANLPKKIATQTPQIGKSHTFFAPQTAKGINALLSENFDIIAFPPSSWSVSGATWDNSGSTASSAFEAAATPTGHFAFFGAGEATAGTEDNLVTPVLHPSASNNTLSYKVNLYQYYNISWALAGAEMYIEFSTNGGTTWTTSTTNVLATLPNYNTASSGWVTQTASLAAYNGQTVQVRFRAIADYGAFQLGIDDVTGPDADIILSANDLILSQIYCSFSGLGYYGLIPNTQVDDVAFDAAFTNVGSAAQTNVSVSADLNNGAFTTTPYGNNPITSVASGANDTLWGSVAYPIVTVPTDFGVKVTVSQDQTDENPANNSDSIYFTIDTAQYMRGSNINYYVTSYSFNATQITPATGFEFGANYHMIGNTTVKAITMPIYKAGGTGTIVGKLYTIDPNTMTRTLVAQTAPYTPTGQFEQFVSIPLTTPYVITGASSTAPIFLTASAQLNISVPTDTIYLLSDGNYLGNDYGMSAVYLNFVTGGFSWTALSGQMPLVGMAVSNSLVSVNGINSDKSVSIYPNPTTGMLNITNADDATVTVFNMLGQEVMNAYNVKTINMNNMANGSYFVKVQTQNNVITKKINLVK